MKNLNVAICDDDNIVVDNVFQYLVKYFKDKHLKVNIHKLNDGSQILTSQIIYDLIILDIEMEKIDGITTKNYLFNHRINSKIIFLTDHDDYRDDAYGKNVYGFVNKERIYQLEIKLNVFINEYLNHRLLNITGVQFDTYDILFIKGNGSYSDFYINDKLLATTIRKNLAEIEEILKEDKSFVRIHRSVIVHLKYVVNIKYNRIFMSDGSELPISRTIVKDIQDRFFEYTREKAKYGIY